MEVEVAAKRIGVFGGTFDPIHIGHLVVAEEARVAFGLERVVFVPAHISPHKLDVAVASGEDRCEMVRLAVRDNPAFTVSRVELDRAGPSFTVDTLRSLHAEYGAETQLYFVMGADSLLAFKTWHKPKEILRLTRLIVVSRPSYALDLEALDRELPGIAAATDLIDSISLDISATDLRARVRQGRPIRYQVPCAVAQYITEHQLYAGDKA